jgi:hypothetical protein
MMLRRLFFDILALNTVRVMHVGEQYIPPFAVVIAAAVGIHLVKEQRYGRDDDHNSPFPAFMVRDDAQFCSVHKPITFPHTVYALWL